MRGFKFEKEYEFNASRRMLFPYVSTAAGLAQWYADDVTIDDDKIYHFIWEGDSHRAKLVAQRANNYVKFEFIDDKINGESAYTEIKLEENEMTQTVFVKIFDFTDIDDAEEARELWDNLIHNLKEIVGG
jgi:uncharacterized protein YndB with AHSA1/START domain